MNTTHRPETRALRHDALFYESLDELIRWAREFIVGGVALGEPALVVLSQSKIEALRRVVPDPYGLVEYVDMDVVGRNPARLFPIWFEFFERHEHAARLRGIAEPVTGQRSVAELSECFRNEHLVNGAWVGTPVWIVCPYDTSSLQQDVLDLALRTHPTVAHKGTRAESPHFIDVQAFDDELSLPPSEGVGDLEFGAIDLKAVRRAVGAIVDLTEAGPERRDDFVLAVNEVATNALLHAGSQGRVKVWIEGSDVVCDVWSAGKPPPLLAGRIAPRPDATSGRGLWMANQLCDLVQVRECDGGTIIRVRMNTTR